MSAVSAYAPTQRNSFLIRHPEAIQRRSSRLKRRRSFALGFLLLVVRFWKSPALQRVLLRLRDLLNNDTTRRLTESEWGQLMRRKGVDMWDLVSRAATMLLERLRSYARQTYSDFIMGDLDREPQDEDADMPLNDSRHSGTTNSATGGLNGEKCESGSLNNGGTIHEHQLRIRSVLMYWFGQYSPDNSQKKLWMIASSSIDQRRRVDADIAEKFEDVPVDLCNHGVWHDWCGDMYGYQGKVAAIVVLDQFSRHIRRHYDPEEKDACPIPEQKDLDTLAYRIAHAFTEEHKSEIECGMIPIPMYVFALMPYRHASTLVSVQYVQKHVEECAALHEQMDGMIRRFRKATNRRMAVLQDEARRKGTDKEVEHDDVSEGEHSGESTADSTNYSAEENPQEKSFSDQDILETFPFDADMTKAKDHPVHRTIRAFLTSGNAHPVRRTKKGTDVSKPVNPVVVSLSGGVDSMVIASVLAHLSHECQYNLYIVAIHIDYANRPESNAEADYVKKFCQSLGIAFKCRRIEEVTRGVTARDDYERIAREVRYGFYRDTVQECKEFVADDSVNVGVMLGHHRGDLRENVLSNAHKGCGPLDLSGMTAVSQNDGVMIYRPLLPLEKSDIYDYAHKFGVPYFKDTTPHWSTRGKLRNKLLPLLQEIYGDGSMDNLSTLATESDEARDLLLSTVLGPFLNQVQHLPMGITFETAPWKKQGLFFWKLFLREALHVAGLGMFSDKSVVSFLARVQDKKQKSGWLQCRRDFAVYLQEDGKVFVYYPDSFPFRKADKYSCDGQVVSFGENKSVRVGPWLVTSELVPSESVSEEEANEMLNRKAVSSMQELMDGYVCYYIRAPLSDGMPKPMVFVSKYTRKSRPRAWKNSDLRVQSTLPLLGNDAEGVKLANDANVYGTDWVVVRVTLVRDGSDISFSEETEANNTMQPKTDGEVDNGQPTIGELSDHDRAVELCRDLNKFFPGVGT